MTREAKQVLEMALGLGDDDRGMVASKLLATLQTPGRSLDDPAYRDEVAHRADQLMSGEAEGQPWDRVVANVRANLTRGS